MDEAVRAFYYLMGWDPETGVPSKITLERLGIGWVVERLADDGTLPQAGRR
jgi:aldehyde:ferredoxin oxidoreductase